MLGLEGESTRAASVVKAAQEAFYAKTGVWPDVDGMPNKLPAPPAPSTSIGTVTGSGDGLTDTNLALTVEGQSDITAAFDGDATDVSFKWTIRSGTAVSIVGDSTTAAVKLQGDEVGVATIRCTLSSELSQHQLHPLAASQRR